MSIATPQLPSDYAAYLSGFKSTKFRALWPAQAHVLGRYSENAQHADLGIELPTGAGKTLIALLIAEAWRANNAKVAILSANKALARQMLSEAQVLGVPAVLMQGKGSEILGIKPATVLGTKILLVNHRELYTKANLARIGSVQKNLSLSAAAVARLTRAIEELMYQDLHPSPTPPNPEDLGTFVVAELGPAQFQNTLAKLKPSTLNEIANLLQSEVSVFLALDTSLKTAYDQIQKGTQVSLAYTATFGRIWVMCT